MYLYIYIQLTSWKKELHCFFQHLCFKIIAVTLALLLYVCVFALPATVEVSGKSSYKGTIVLKPFSGASYLFQAGSNLFKSTLNSHFPFKTVGKNMLFNYSHQQISHMFNLDLLFWNHLDPPRQFHRKSHSPVVHCCPNKPRVAGKSRTQIQVPTKHSHLGDFRFNNGHFLGSSAFHY